MTTVVRPAHTAAHWRGGLVGACSAAVAVGAHGIGGGPLPGGAALVLLVLGCGVVGVAAGGKFGSRGIGTVAAFLVIGQAVGHLTLAYAAGHAHGLTAGPGMLLAHLGAALACAVLIGTAERLWSALAMYVWRLVRALTATAFADTAPGGATRSAVAGTVRFRLGCTAGTRGPPPLFV